MTAFKNIPPTMRKQSQFNPALSRDLHWSMGAYYRDFIDALVNPKLVLALVMVVPQTGFWTASGLYPFVFEAFRSLSRPRTP